MSQAEVAWSGPLGEALAALIDHRGKTPKKLGGDWTEDGVRVYSALHMKDGRLEGENARRISQEMYERWMPIKLQAGDVLLTSEAPLGEVAYLASSQRACLGQRLFGLRPRREILDPRYLYYWLQHPLGRSQLLGRASGTTVSGIRQAELVKVHLDLPTLATQRKIAAVLAAYDELIDNNDRRIEIMEEMAQAVYRQWFVDGRFPGHEEVPHVDSPLGPMPEGWAVRRVVELAGGNEGVVGGPFGSKLGRKDYVEVGVPVIRGTNLNGALGWSDHEFVFVSSDKFGELRGNAAAPGDIIVTQRGTLGQVGLVPSAAPWPDLVVSQSQMRIRVDPGSSTTLFVFHSLRWPSTNQRLVDHAMSAGVPHINLGILRDFKLLVPPLPLAKAYDQAVGPMRALAENLSAQNANLRATRDLLLPKLVSGDIDLSELEIETEWLAS